MVDSFGTMNCIVWCIYYVVCFEFLVLDRFYAVGIDSCCSPFHPIH